MIDTIGKALSVKYAHQHGVKYESIKNDQNNKYNLSTIKQIKSEYDSDPDTTKSKYPELFYYYDGLCGCVVSQSQHPAGIIASPINLIDFCGAFIGDDGQQILPIDMDECHDAGLVKYDILGLKTVGVISKTCQLLGRNYPYVHEINFNDEAVYQDMTNNHTTIFQFESKFAGESLKKMKCQSVFDLSLVNACIRPSGVTYRDKLLNREWNHNPSQMIDELLRNNYGFLCYQEDTIAFLQQICGFSGSDADNIRRFIAKKKADKIAEAMPKILDGYCQKSSKPREVAEEEAKQFLEIIDASSAYQFGYNHSIAYSIMSYLCGYFRHYYPVEYCTSFLNCAKNDDDIFNGTALLKSLNITLAGIKFRHSGSEYTCDADNRVIHKGIASIKYMNSQIANELYDLRNNKYDSFVELMYDIYNLTSVDSRQLDTLIKLDFFSEFGDVNKNLCIASVMSKILKTKQTQFQKSKIVEWGIPENLVEEFSIGESPSAYKYNAEQYRTLLINWSYWLDNNINACTLYQKIQYQIELLGYIDYTNDLLDSRIIAVTGLDTTYSPRFKGICLKSGATCEFRVSKKRNPKDKHINMSFADLPFKNGDILYITKCQRKPKQIKLNERWINDPSGETNWWITDYKICNSM